MRTDDLFNAINDIDIKYVSDAWNDTEPETDTMVIYESTSKVSKAKIFGVVTAFAALISAACLAVYIRVNQLPNNNVTPPDSAVGSSGISGTSGELHASDGDMPIKLYGPDLVQIKYGDVTGVTLPDGKAVAAENFDPDNWESIVCDGFTYLAPPHEHSYTNVQFPELNWDDLVNRGDETCAAENYYKRFNVGDKYGDLTVKSAMTTFHKNSEAEGKLWECIVEFEGEVTINAYIIREIGANYINNAFCCVPMFNECTLPVMSFQEDGDGYASKAYAGEYLSGEFKYSSEYPSFYLYNDNGIRLQNVVGDKNYAAVTMKISDIHMESFTYSTKINDYITASIEEIRDYSGERPEGSLPFDLVGLDGQQILFNDVDDIVDDNMDPITIDNLTADNWYQIWCDGMCYLGAPTGNNYNSIDEYYSFNDDTGEFATGFGDIIRHKYQRYNVGGNFNGLQISSAMTVFSRTAEHAPDDGEYEELPMAQKLQMSMIQFDGQAKLDAYLTHDKNGNLSCIPLNGETSLPVLLPGNDGYSSRKYDGCFESADGTKLYYHTELPRIQLNNSNGIDLSKYFGDKDYVKVELTLENIALAYSGTFVQDSGFTADIASVSSLGGTNDITGVLPFELIGADGKQLRYEDISSAEDTYGRKIDLTDLTADNWTFIECEFAYLAEPNGNTFKRYNIGDTICGLTITAAEAQFRNFTESNHVEEKYLGSTASLDGVLETQTYIAMSGGSYYCANIGLPTACCDLYALKMGQFVPKVPGPAFSVADGFSTDDIDYASPSLEIERTRIKRWISRLLDGEVIPVTASLSDITLKKYNISANVYQINDR